MDKHLKENIIMHLKNCRYSAHTSPKLNSDGKPDAQATEKTLRIHLKKPTVTNTAKLYDLMRVTDVFQELSVKTETTDKFMRCGTPYIELPDTREIRKALAEFELKNPRIVPGYVAKITMDQNPPSSRYR